MLEAGAHLASVISSSKVLGGGQPPSMKLPLQKCDVPKKKLAFPSVPTRSGSQADVIVPASTREESELTDAGSGIMPCSSKARKSESFVEARPMLT
jgi:hypothetical protein